MCLRAKGIDNDGGGVGEGRQPQGLSDNNGGVGGEQGIEDASEGLEKTTEAAGARRRARGIYNDDGGTVRGRRSQRLQQQQRISQRRIEYAFKGSEEMTEAAAARQRARWIGNENGVSIFLAFASIVLTLYHLCLIAVSF